MKPQALVFAALAVLYVIGQYWQERRVLAAIREMHPERAMALHEARRRRNDLTLIIITAVSVLAAIGAWVYVRYR